MRNAAAGCKSVHQNQRKTATYAFVERLQRVTDYGSGNYLEGWFTSNHETRT